ncbi:ensconsin isoform X2 [Spea bombifrons]|uniref:ensconsin isoform X2 n=1 Tax=Spea bombifrons TaxID=233779 RepID=UPI00234A7D8C|nr:ensconsin isoform X2 [Spea bombifrons]
MLIFLKPRNKKRTAGKMPGSNTAIRQERMKKPGTRPTPPVLFTISEEDELQKNGTDRKAKESDDSQVKVQEKKAASSHPHSQGPLSNVGSRSEPHITMKVDERQRLARERREEREKLIAARESLWLEKEARARQHYEKHLEERKKKLEEQRIKEERRRAAVDEKRKMRLEEEKERHEAVVRRTMERGQKPKQKNSRWSWGGALQSHTNISSSDPDRRSVSTMNLSKHVDPVINKRLSTSSATLLNSPDRGRRPPLSPWESSVVSRLLTPTHSYLARSKSIAALSGDAVIPICPRSASCSPISPQPFKSANTKSLERPKVFVTTPEAISRRKTTHFAGSVSLEKKEMQRENVLLTPTPNIKRTTSPTIPKWKSPAAGLQHKSPAPLSSTMKPAASPSTIMKAVTYTQRPPSPGNVRPIKKETKDDSKRKSEAQNSSEAPERVVVAEPEVPADAVTAEERPSVINLATCETVSGSPVLPSTPVSPSPTVTGKPFAGTNNPEEATRILAEKRRLAREQREREEQEKREREEEERKKKEELAKRKAEERARREEEAQRQEAERKQREEEECQQKEKMLQQLAQEKEQKEKEEAERLQKQKEEAERIRIEREKHFQKEEQERSERKKRLEEIMKRTRRSEGGEKANVQRNGEIVKSTESTGIPPSPLSEQQEPVSHQNPIETAHNGESPRVIAYPQAGTMDSMEKQANENGLFSPNNNFEEIINLPVGTRAIKLDCLNNEGTNMKEIPLNPKLAFEEQTTLVSVPQVDNVQTPQTTEVI